MNSDLFKISIFCLLLYVKFQFGRSWKSPVPHTCDKPAVVCPLKIPTARLGTAAKFMHVETQKTHKRERERQMCLTNYREKFRSSEYSVVLLKFKIIGKNAVFWVNNVISGRVLSFLGILNHFVAK